MSETISERSSKLYQILTGKAFKREKYRLFDWEPLLDSFLSFYDVCCTLDVQKKDKQVGNFVRKFRNSIEEIRNLRPNKNDFEIIKTIGRGHFGEVYVVKEKGTCDVYAMKILKKTATLSNDNIAFFEEERDIMAFANSSWVTSLQYAFQDPENLYLVMEFLPGGDLLNLLTKYDDGIMEQEDARFYLAEIIMAVHAVHAIGYVHRDVKPENILLDMTGHVKLADFGSAARLADGKNVFCKMPVGTPEYIAPEVLQSMNTDGGIYGSECDWWSVGVVGYEMMCGILPFESSSGVLQLYSQIINFKNTLTFPEDVEISEISRALIHGLLEEQKKRMTYNDLAQHDFFKNMDWTTLKCAKPPYIPQLRDSLDTSNFNDLRSTKPNAPKPIEPSLGNTIPFIGFTFTKNISAPKVETLKSRSSMSYQGSFSEDHERTRDGMKVSQLTITVEMLQQRISERENKFQKLESDLAILNDELRTKTESIKDLTLNINRLADDKNIIKAQLDISTQSNKDINELKTIISSLNDKIESDKIINSSLSRECEIYKLKLDQSRVDLELAIKKISDFELSIKESEKLQLKTQNELKDSLDELKLLLDKTTSDYQQKLNDSLNENKTYRDLSEQLEKKIKMADERRINNEQVDYHEITELTSKLAENATRFEEIKKKYHDLEDIIAVKETEMKSSEIIIVKLNQSIRNYETQIEQNESKIKDFEIQIKDLKLQILTSNCVNENLTTENIQLKLAHDQKYSKLVKLQETFDKIEPEFNEEIKKVNDKNTLAQIEINNLNSCLTEKSTEIVNLRACAVEHGNSLSILESEKIKLENEIKQLTSVISAQKISNFQMSQELEEARTNISQLETQNDEINSNMSRIDQANKDHIYKLDSTIAQQSKLINYLHAENSKKKGVKLSSIGSDHHIKGIMPITGTMKKTRDVEQKLEFQQMQTMKLNREVNELRRDLKIMKSHHSKCQFKSSFNQSNSIFYTHPSDMSAQSSTIDIVDPVLIKNEHILSDSVCYTPNMCFVCLAPIAFAKPITECSVCKVFCHASCRNNFPSFPCADVPCLSSIINLVDCSRLYKIYPELDDFKTKLPYIGYLSVPQQVSHNKYDWHKRQFKLEADKLTIISLTEGEPEIMGVINFKDMTTSCRVRSSVHTSDLIFTYLTNAPYVFGLEVEQTESDHFSLNMSCISQDNDSKINSTILFMLAQSLEEKRFWVRLMQDVIKLNSKICEETIGEPFHTINTSTLSNISSIATIDDDLILIGHQQGVALLQCSDNSLCNCFADKIQCYDLYLLGTMLFAIIGEKRQLAILKPEKAKNIMRLKFKKNQLVPTTFQNIFECCSILYAEIRLEVINLFVSTPSQLIGFKITADFNTTVHLRMQTDDLTISSLTLLDNTLIFCQDKLYVFDIQTNVRREFLDPSDHSMAFLIYGSNPESNYPMNIFKMNRSKTPEFLICYSEFGLIVDENGRRLFQGNIRWDQIPLSFHYFNGVLLVCYPDKLEIRSFKIGSVSELNEDSIAFYKYIDCPIVLEHNNNTSSQETVIVSLQIADYSLAMFKQTLKHFERQKSILSNRTDDSKIVGDEQKPAKLKSFFSRRKK